MLKLKVINGLKFRINPFYLHGGKGKGDILGCWFRIVHGSGIYLNLGQTITDRKLNFRHD